MQLTHCHYYKTFSIHFGAVWKRPSIILGKTSDTLAFAIKSLEHRVKPTAVLPHDHDPGARINRVAWNDTRGTARHLVEAETHLSMTCRTPPSKTRL